MAHVSTQPPAGASAAGAQVVVEPRRRSLQATSKDASIETLRGIAIVLVVAFHAIDVHLARLEPGSAYALLPHLSFSLAYVRMPLFTVISGFVYSIRPVRRERTRAFLIGKARRILLPFFSVATLQYVLQASLPGVHHPVPLSGIWRIYLFGFSHFWFLQAIALVFLLVALLDRAGCMDRTSGWLACLGASAALNLVVPPIDLLGIGGFTYLLPYFILGCGLNRHADSILRPAIVASAAAVALVGLAAQQAAWFGLLDVSTHTRSPLALTVGLCVMLVVVRFRRKQALLARLGVYSFAIYLFHQIALAGGPRLAHLLGLHGLLVVFSWKLLLGLSLPAFVEVVLMRSMLLRRVFLGLR